MNERTEKIIEMMNEFVVGLLSRPERFRMQSLIREDARYFGELYSTNYQIFLDSAKDGLIDLAN